MTGMVDQPVSVMRPGARLDRYELLSLVAEGGMASVWVARLFGKHGFEKLVAIKTILPKYAEDPQFRRMFLDEAHIAANIEHTNVARILDLGEENGALYLVMEWVDGDSIHKTQRLIEAKGLSLPVGIVLRVMADACAGLHSAHELRGRDGALLRVVHRDVSPQNILVSRDGAAKLIDFGIAKALDRSSDDTGSGTLKGKIQYMAPEQALGRTLDRRADVWSIGAVLYGFFTGKQIYEGEGQLAILHQLTSGKPPQPLPSMVPEPIARVIEGALRFAPEDRWPTAAEVQRQLEKAMTQADCQTTTSDVAAFVAEHLPERQANRRETIERSILAAGDPVTIPPKPSVSRIDLRNAPTVVTPMPASAPDGPTPGAASIEIETRPLPRAPPEPRRFGLVLGAAAILVVGGATALVYRLQPSRQSQHAAPAPAARPAVAPASAEPAPPQAWITQPPASPQPAPTATLVPIPVEALPVASAPSSAPLPAPRPRPPPARPPRDSAKKKVIDDGF